MREMTTTVYTFNELSDAAKAKAREWYRSFDNWQAEFQPAETAAKLLGISFAQARGERGPDIRYSGFYSQGDGLSFVGTYSYQPGCVRAISREFPRDTELQRIARELQALQKLHFYGLTATLEQSGHYCHKYTMSAEVCDRNGELYNATRDAILSLMRDFADWIYADIRDDYEATQEDDYVDDCLSANEYEFTASGKRCVTI